MLLEKIEARGSGLRLLDVGFGAGELARRVRKRCTFLAGIELDPEAARASAGLFDRCAQGHLLETLESLDESPFDVVVAGDVLEHIEEPGRAVRLLHRFVRPGGVLLVSLPNVANVTVRLGLLAGRFDYTSRGILDGTHLRFFTRRTGRALLESAGYKVVRAEATAMPVELAFPALGRPPVARLVRGGALLSARLWPTLFGYQFVFEAVPA